MTRMLLKLVAGPQAWKNAFGGLGLYKIGNSWTKAQYRQAFQGLVSGKTAAIAAEQLYLRYGKSPAAKRAVLYFAVVEGGIAVYESVASTAQPSPKPSD